MVILWVSVGVAMSALPCVLCSTVFAVCVVLASIRSWKRAALLANLIAVLLLVGGAWNMYSQQAPQQTA